jgi:hypothetical protein
VTINVSTRAVRISRSRSPIGGVEDISILNILTYDLSATVYIQLSAYFAKT